MTMLHREQDADKVARNADAIFDLHAVAIDWLEDYTGIAYPWQKLDFALIPAFQYNGMEHVGAIQYRASSLMLDESPTQSDLLRRASLIAHETAHMWFGNLVTMRWFDDVWTKEVFANFMAGKIVNPSFPDIDHDLSFLVRHYPAAYGVDRSEGANPIRQHLPNLNDAGQMYGPIIYDKAPIMMRQLEMIVGEEGFRDGMREYLTRFAFSNATWPELIAILDARTPVDLAGWSDVWVNTAGRPEFELRHETEERGEGLPVLVQRDPAGRGRVWPQRFGLRGAGTQEVVVTSAATALQERSSGSTAPLLFNADGLGYGLFPADMRNLQRWAELDDVEKGAELLNIHEQVLARTIDTIDAYVLALLDIVSNERNQLILELALDQLSRAYVSLLTEAQRREHIAHVETTLWQAMLSDTDPGRTKILFEAFAHLAENGDQLQALYAVWSGERVIEALILSEDDDIDLAETLAIRLPDRSSAIIERQLERIENPDSRRRLAFVAPSLSSAVEVRDAFFASLALERNRETESWVLDALENLHHPSRIATSEKYILPSLELLEEIQATGDIFFPSRWLVATLENHRSAAAAATVREFLAQRPGYNAQLRMKILQAADMLFRASRIVAAARTDIE
jgi:aminopeptidase N